MFPDVYINVKTRNITEVICSGQPSVVTLIHILSIIKVTLFVVSFIQKTTRQLHGKHPM